MLVNRYENSSTDKNSAVLSTLIRDENCKEIRLFVSPDSITPDYTNVDGPNTNLPLIAALAKYTIPGISDVYILFDGNFLNVARRTRFIEVKNLLDEAQNSGKTLFTTVTAPFTSSMDATVAVNLLLTLNPTIALTVTSRAQYFSYLSSISESQYPV